MVNIPTIYGDLIGGWFIMFIIVIPCYTHIDWCHFRSHHILSPVTRCQQLFFWSHAPSAGGGGGIHLRLRRCHCCGAWWTTIYSSIVTMIPIIVVKSYKSYLDFAILIYNIKLPVILRIQKLSYLYNQYSGTSIILIAVASFHISVPTPSAAETPLAPHHKAPHLCEGHGRVPWVTPWWWSSGNGYGSKPCTPVVHIKIAGKWMWITTQIWYHRFWPMAKSRWWIRFVKL